MSELDLDAMRPPEEALAEVARHIIHSALAYYGEDGDEWEQYPDIGEHDWERIVEMVREAGVRYEAPPRCATDPWPLRDALDLLRHRAETES